MIERWFVVAPGDDGFRLLMEKSVSPGSICWAQLGPTTKFGWIRRQHPSIFKLYAFASRDSARNALTMVKRRGSLAQSARIVRLRVWSKGERTKLACNWAGIPTLENGKPISTGRRVELLAERAMGLGATVHQQRAELYTLRAAKTEKRPTLRGNRS